MRGFGEIWNLFRVLTQMYQEWDILFNARNKFHISNHAYI